MKQHLTATLAAACLAAAIPAGTAKAQSQPFLGQISWFAGTFAPRGWALCDGQILPINQYQALYSLLGTTYGGDGRTSFALPDIRSRTPIHVGGNSGTGPGLSTYDLGQKGGVETVTLTVPEMPAHNHVAVLKGTETGADGTSPADSAFGEASANVYQEGAGSLGATLVNGSVTETNAGGGQSHTNVQPYLTLNCIIALQGTFPSRN